MGSTNFFSKLASVDPLAQALNLPGAHKYAQAQAQDVQTNPGPYAGQTPTLAAANVGYAPGTTAQGATPGWTPNQATQPGNGAFNFLQKAANLSGNASGGGAALGVPTRLPSTNPISTSNQYVQAARGAQGNIYG